MESREIVCWNCGAKTLKIWGNKKGYTCQKCGAFFVLDTTSGYEDENIYWDIDEGVLKSKKEGYKYGKLSKMQKNSSISSS